MHIGITTLKKNTQFVIKMKNPIKTLRSVLWTITLMALAAVISSVATMHYISSLPADQYKYMQMENRWLNWPQKDCYNPIEVEMIIQGP